MTARQRVAEALTRRRDLPFAGIRADWDLVALNGDRLLVRGMERYPVPETLYATSYWGELQLSTRQALGFLLAPTGRLVRRSRILGDLSTSEYEAQGVRDQELSVQAALLAAGAHLGVPGKVLGGGVHVDDVDPEGPSAQRLRRGDVITHVSGEEICTLPEFLKAVEGQDPVQLRYTAAQDGRRAEAGGSLELWRDGNGRLGVEVRTHRQHVIPSVDAEVLYPAGTAGPSTGLVLALSVLDVLTPGSITGGKRVAGTGAIGPEGEVMAVGGVEKKVLSVLHHRVGAFVVPAENEAEAVAAAGQRCEVIPVSTLSEAVAALVARGGVEPVLP